MKTGSQELKIIKTHFQATQNISRTIHFFQQCRKLPRLTHDSQKTDCCVEPVYDLFLWLGSMIMS